MNKSILISCTLLAAFSLMAFGYLNWSNKNYAEIDLVYKVDSRFLATITKENLYKAKSILDIVPKEANWSKESFQSVKVAVLQDGDEISAMGDDKVLNAAQTALLQSTDYSTNFYIRAQGERESTYTGRSEAIDFVYYITVIPEQGAEYAGGTDALIAYLKENSLAYTAIVEEDQLQPGQISFTVTKSGAIENVSLNSTSGYPSLDEVLVELVGKMPGKWHPAANSKGEKVDQELVFFFGKMGC